MELFSVRHYTGEDRPTIKGNGFDGLEIGEDREEAERFVACVNELLKDATAWRNLTATMDSAGNCVVGTVAGLAQPGSPKGFRWPAAYAPTFKTYLVRQAAIRWVETTPGKTLRDALLETAEGK